jgi:putative hydrolase of the HAD superfamily
VPLDAVLFDWGNTLMRWEPDDAYLDEGHRAGLAAVGRAGLPEPAALSALVRDRWEELFGVEPPVEIEYPARVRELLGELGADLSAEELDRFLEAEHEAWAPAHALGAHTHALLETLRARGLRLGLVSNAFDPPRLLHRDLERTGIAARIDHAVFSSEVGRRKPDPAIFRHALDALGVEAGRAMFVGDRLKEDVAGAREVGMTAVQALWFHADDDPGAPEPDHRAFTAMDVLNLVRRLAPER